MISYSGVTEISPQWVASHRTELHVLDVRTAVETAEESTRIQGAQLIPINELRDRINEVPKNRPVVTICRAGGKHITRCWLAQGCKYQWRSAALAR